MRTKASLPIAVDVPATFEAATLFDWCLEQVEGASKTAWKPVEDTLVRAIVLLPQERAAYLGLIDCMIAVNRWSLGRWPFPFLYDGDITYDHSPEGMQLFQSLPALFLRGKGDCKDLVAARLAEIDSPHARALLIDTGERTPSGGVLYHVAIENSGEIEDPSRILGML